MIAYKLVRQRKDGSLGPLFINAKQRLPIGVWLAAKAHKTKGFAFRPGWHCTSKPVAPHLSKTGRIWVQITIKEYTQHLRPINQGGLWYTANMMRIDSILHGDVIK